MKSVAILQARTNSTRLPAKALLPVAGLPMAVLACKRAANSGQTVVVATSDQPEDDSLAAALDRFELPYFRGSLHDTLQRVVDALVPYEDDCIVVRLTADNVLPDGLLIDELIDDYCVRLLDYLCINSPHSGLPFGMSAEVTRLGYLREAATKASDRYDREHVMPFIIRKFGRAYFEKYKQLAMGHYRCTVDNYDDYVNVQKLFSGVEDPIHQPALGLVERLDDCSYQPIVSRAVSRFVLGTAQLGMNYGVTNSSGRPAKADAENIVKVAIGNGVAYLDSARAYEDSESVIGDTLASGWANRVRTVTKLSPFVGDRDSVSELELRSSIDASVYQSCAQLRCRQLDVLMLHRLGDSAALRGAIWGRLRELQNARVIDKLGASVQSPDELRIALELPRLAYLQMPFNLVDWRWEADVCTIRKARENAGVVVHVRSVFLQGLLLTRDHKCWSRAHVDDSDSLVRWLGDQVRRCDRSGLADLCLAYVRSKPWIDGVVIGVETEQQLLENIRHFDLPCLTPSQTESIESSRPRLNHTTLDPSQWKLN